MAGRRTSDTAGLPARGHLRVGWVEHVALPELGLLRLAAKIDTGARTSALHVNAMEHARDGSTAGSSPRILSIVLPSLGRTKTKRIVRVAVEDWVEVRDTSGRRERRPVISTTLEIGSVRRTIRLSLTDRGDMRYPMLVGRTALVPGMLIDPFARFVLRVRRPSARKRMSSKVEERRKI